MEVTNMASLRKLAMRISSLFAKDRAERELDEELRAHFDMLVEQNERRGMTGEDARRAARMELGGAEQIKESVQDQRGLPLFESVIADIRYAARMLRKSPGFTTVAVLTLALGIGANTAIFTLIDALYLKPLPVRDPRQLVRIYAKSSPENYGAGFSDPEFKLLREHASSFSAIAAETQIAQLHIVASGDSAEVRGAFVSADYFDVLGVALRVGRVFLPSEDSARGSGVAIISYQFWKTYFVSNPAALGMEIRVNRVPLKIIGVARPGFYGDIVGEPVQIWIPTSMLGACGFACGDGSSSCAVYDALIGRLAGSQSAIVAQNELRSIMVWSATDWQKRPTQRQIVVASATGIPPDERAESHAQTHLLMSVTALLLLIACANIAGLLLARGVARRKEIAVRLSLGAGPSRIIRQLLTENLLLTAISVLLGLWFSLSATGVLSNYYSVDSEGFHHLYDFSLDWRVLAYSASTALLAAVSFGLLPAIRAARQDLVAELKDVGASAGHSGGWVRHGLVVAQVALTMILVVSAGLLVRSALAVQRGTNFDPQKMVLLRLRPELIKYSPQQVESLVRRTMQTLQSTAGVQSAAFIEGGEGLVWNGQNGRDADVILPGREQNLRGAAVRARTQDVSSSFFATLRIPLLQGRAFDDRDSDTAPRVAIVNDALARQLWPRSTAIDRSLLIDGNPFRVVGVVANIQPSSEFETAAPHLYLSYWQTHATRNGDIRMAIRLAGDPARELPRIRRIVQSVDPLVPLGEDMSMAEQMGLHYMPVLLGRSVMIFCGFLALALSAVGIFSVLAFAVQARTREIGIRMALGAEPVNVLRMVVWGGVRLAAIGAGLGAFGAPGATYLARSLLFGVTRNDPWTFAGVIVLLVLVALVACCIPARRAMRVDPMMALRHE